MIFHVCLPEGKEKGPCLMGDCHSPILGKLRSPAPTRLAAFEDDRLGELDTS